MGTQKFLWLANNDIQDNLFGENGIRLPNVPHGLNRYQYDYDAFVSLSALNPSPDHFKFLQWIGVDPEEAGTPPWFEEEEDDDEEESSVVK